MTILVPQSASERKAWVRHVESHRLLAYQRRWLNDKSRLKMAEKSRQIGFSWCDALDTVTETAMVDWPFDSWISSRDQIQAQLYAQDCKFWAGIYDMAAGDVGERVLDPEKNISALCLPFANGRTAWSLSSNVDAQAGKRGTRKLDELALNKRNRELIAIAQPGITWGGRMVGFSSHRGTGNCFNELIVEIKHKGNPKGYSLHTVTLADALRDGLLIKLKQRWRSLNPDDNRLTLDEDGYLQLIRNECIDEETFDQEYMCKPSDDASAFLSYELIDGVKYAPTEPWFQTLAELAKSPNPLYLGVDVGRKRDLTVLWLLEKVGGVYLTRQLVELEKTRFAVQRAMIYDILELPNLRRACFDNTGIGMQLAEEAQEKYRHKVEPVTFTPAVKEALAYPVRGAMEDKSVRIPDDRKVTADLRGIRKETTAADNVRFTGERTENGHCDRFWALALGIHAGKTPSSTYFGAVI